MLRGSPRARLAARVLLASGSPQISRVVRAGLELRALATALLHGASDRSVEQLFEAVRAGTERSWRAFLVNERCAIWLHAELQSRRLLSKLEGGARTALLDVREDELRRLLMARAQLLEIGRMAEAQDIPVVALKGGVAALLGTPLVDLSDVDVLTTPEHALRLAELLDARGYTSAEVEATPKHLTPRSAAARLDVEVHSAIAGVQGMGGEELLARARAVPNARAVLQLAPADYLWHLVLHVGTTHLDRRGAIRDQLLIRHAARQCSDTERNEVLERMRAHPATAELMLVWHAARAGAGSAIGDPFVRLSAARYAAAAVIFSQGTLPPAWLWKSLQKLIVEMVVDGAGYRRQFRRLAAPAPVVARRLSGGEKAGWGAQALLVLLRTVRLVSLTPVAAGLAFRSARIARSYTRHHSLRRV